MKGAGLVTYGSVDRQAASGGKKSHEGEGPQIKGAVIARCMNAPNY